MRVARIALLAALAAAAAWPWRRRWCPRRPAQDPGGLEVAARRAGRDVDRQDGGGPVVVCRDAAGMARHDGPRRPGLSPRLSGHRPVRRRKRAVPVSRFERRRRRRLRRRASRSATQESPAYAALLLRKDGSATVVRRTGGRVEPIAGWAAVEGVSTPRRQGRREARASASRPTRRRVTFLVDGVKVATTPRADAPADGHFGLRIGRGGQHPRRPARFHAATGAARRPSSPGTDPIVPAKFQ